MKKANVLNYMFFLILITCFASCKNQSKEEKTEVEEKTKEPYFEGEIALSESRGLYGSLFKVHSTYIISENYIKREQKLGGINSVFDNYAGIVIDLKKDSITLYYADKLSEKKNKHTVSINTFKTNKKYKSFPKSLPSPIDNTFTLLPDYHLIKQVKDSTKIKGFKSDYTFYNDESQILKQEVFDSKKIKIKRELLEMVFLNIPDEINFPLKSDLRTTISDINNDSIVSGKQSKAIDLFIRDVFNKSDEKTDLEKIAKNKWVKLGLNLLKKGVDLNIHITTNLSDLKDRKTELIEFSLPALDFIEISDIEDFMDELPSEGGHHDFDDFDDFDD